MRGVRIDEVKVGEEYHFRYGPRRGKVLGIDWVEQYGRRERRLRVQPLDDVGTLAGTSRHANARDILRTWGEHSRIVEKRAAAEQAFETNAEKLEGLFDRLGIENVRLSKSSMVEGGVHLVLSGDHIDALVRGA